MTYPANAGDQQLQIQAVAYRGLVGPHNDEAGQMEVVLMQQQQQLQRLTQQTSIHRQQLKPPFLPFHRHHPALNAL